VDFGDRRLGYRFHGNPALGAEFFVSGNFCTAGCTKWHMISKRCKGLILLLFGIKKKKNMMSDDLAPKHEKITVLKKGMRKK
jgi:hypothetical protein